MNSAEQKYIPNVQVEVEKMKRLAPEPQRVSYGSVNPEKMVSFAESAISDNMQKEYVARLRRNPKECPHCGGNEYKDIFKKKKCYLIKYATPCIIDRMMVI